MMMTPLIASAASQAPPSRVRTRGGRRHLGQLLLLVALLGPGCQTLTGSGTSPAVEAPVWPSPPAAARIRSNGEIRTPADLGIRPHLLRRVWNWITGSDVPRLVRPYAITTDPEGRLWVADPGARRVHIFDPKRSRYRAVPDKDAPALVSPVAITNGNNGEIFVSDSAQGVIRRFDSKTEELPAWSAEGKLIRPTGLAFDPGSGLLWVTDTARHLLIALDSEGKVQRTIGGRGSAPGRFNFPTHLALDSEGQLVVSDTLNFRVQRVTQQGEPLGTIGELGDGPGSLSKPKGVALDSDGHVYVVDSLFDNIQIFEPGGQLLLHFGDHGSGPTQLWLPGGIHIANGHQIYVADSYNQRIQAFEYIPE